MALIIAAERTDELAGRQHFYYTPQFSEPVLLSWDCLHGMFLTLNPDATLPASNRSYSMEGSLR